MDRNGGSNDKHYSNYGLKTHTPEGIKNQWKEGVEREQQLHRNHICTEGERDQINVIKKQSNKEITYFNNHKQHTATSAYDRLFHMHEGYHSQLKRDDRMANLGLDVNAEESRKAIPILSSSSYGHRNPLEIPTRKHCRVALVRRDFYRDTGTNIPLSQ